MTAENDSQELTRVTCEQGNFMDPKRRTCLVWDSQGKAAYRERVLVDNRQGIRQGEVAEVTFFKQPDGRVRRRLKVRLDPLDARR